MISPPASLRLMCSASGPFANSYAVSNLIRHLPANLIGLGSVGPQRTRARSRPGDFIQHQPRWAAPCPRNFALACFGCNVKERVPTIMGSYIVPRRSFSKIPLQGDLLVGEFWSIRPIRGQRAVETNRRTARIRCTNWKCRFPLNAGWIAAPVPVFMMVADDGERPGYGKKSMAERMSAPTTCVGGFIFLEFCLLGQPLPGPCWQDVLRYPPILPMVMQKCRRLRIGLEEASRRVRGPTCLARGWFGMRFVRVEL